MHEAAAGLEVSAYHSHYETAAEARAELNILFV